MKRKWVIWIVLVLVLIVIAISLFNNLTISHSDAQGIVNNSPMKLTNSHVEIIRITYPNNRITIHIRDRINLIDIDMEYANKELILHKIINNEESTSKAVSIGKDFNSGELIGSTWRFTKQATLEIQADFKKSIVEERILILQASEWRSVSVETIKGEKVDKVKSEQMESVEFVYFDYEDGVPVRRELFNKDQMGNPFMIPERVEEYSYYDAIPSEYLDTKQVVIRQGPARIQLDIAD